MKLVAIKNLSYITEGKVYEGDLIPSMYDPNTLQPLKLNYFIFCDDDLYRKFDSELFITLEESRNIKLKELEV